MGTFELTTRPLADRKSLAEYIPSYDTLETMPTSILDGRIKLYDGKFYRGAKAGETGYSEGDPVEIAEGLEGSSGTSGTSGTDGAPGTSGTSGTDGAPGTSGTDGAPGTSGTSGTDGAPGTSGTSGTSIVLPEDIVYENSESSRIIQPTDDVNDNGQAFKDAYDEAKTATPNGDPLSNDNRFTILLLPGTYNITFMGDPFEMDTDFINVVSFSGNTDVVFIGLGSGGAPCIELSASNIKLVGIDGSPSPLFRITDTVENLYIKNCKGGDFLLAKSDTPAGLVSFSGDIINCKSGDFFLSSHESISASLENIECGDFSLVNTVDASIIMKNCNTGIDFMLNASDEVTITSSSFFDCNMGSDAFRIDNGTLSHTTFINCNAGANSFTIEEIENCKFINCNAGDTSFQNTFFSISNPSIEHSIFYQCTAGDNSFDSVYINDTKFIHCLAGNASFGGFSTEMNNGAYLYCEANDESFQGQVISGSFEYCKANELSFGGPPGSTITNNGTYIGCIGSDITFTGVNVIGSFKNCTAGDDSFGSFASTNISGSFEFCTAGANSFGAYGTLSGNVIKCIGDDGSFGSLDGTVTGKVADCVLKSGTFDTGSVTTGNVYSLLQMEDGEIINV